MCTSFFNVPAKGIIVIFLTLVIYGLEAMQKPETKNPLVCSQLFNKYTTKASLNELCNVISLELLAYEMIVETLTYYQSGNLHKFDPNVGDTACQIRTDKVLELYQQKSELVGMVNAMITDATTIKEKLKKLHQTMQKTLQENNYNSVIAIKKELDQGWHSFLVDHNVKPMALSDDLKFLVMSHIITTYYSENSEHKVKVQKELAKRFGFNQKFIALACNETRKMLNSMTNNHITSVGLRVAQQVPHLQWIPAALGQTEELKPWKSHACYPSFVALMTHWWLKKVTILLRSKVVCNYEQ